MMGKKKLSQVRAEVIAMLEKLPGKSPEAWFAKEIEAAKGDADRDTKTLDALRALLGARTTPASNSVSNGNTTNGRNATKEFKKYTQTARRGAKGEAFFESLIVDFAIPHRVARHNDLGIDFICECIHGDRPSGLLFLAQVKSTTTDEISCKHVGTSNLNALEEYVLEGVKKVDRRTINYWRGLGLPAFLFVVVESRSSEGNQLECYYKRYTPLLDEHADQNDKNGTRKFYKVSKDAEFLAFANREQEVFGFARDLVIDYMRLSYAKGHIIQLTPSQIGFWPFPSKGTADSIKHFPELIRWNRKKIEETCQWTSDLLAHVAGA
jgi:Domain of unknown function (DUF4365)